MLYFSCILYNIKIFQEKNVLRIILLINIMSKPKIVDYFFNRIILIYFKISILVNNVYKKFITV